MGASSVHEEAIGSTTNIRVVLETDSTIENSPDSSELFIYLFILLLQAEADADDR